MPFALQVERDAEGLHQALRTLFEEAYVREQIGDVPEDASEDTFDRVYQDLPSRDLSPGYYSRAEYLLDLGTAIELGAQYAAAQLARADVQGLQQLRRAKAGFERDHPPCPQCGTRQPNRHMLKCVGCGVKFAGRDN